MLSKLVTRASVAEALKLVSVALLGGLTGWFWPDNPIEQYAENYIQKQTGITVDIAELEGSKPKQ